MTTVDMVIYLVAFIHSQLSQIIYQKNCKGNDYYSIKVYDCRYIPAFKLILSSTAVLWKVFNVTQQQKKNK